MNQIIKGFTKPENNTKKFRSDRAGKERQLADSYTLLYWDGNRIREALEIRTYWGSGYNTMYACCWIRERVVKIGREVNPEFSQASQIAGGCKVNWNYETRGVHRAICAAGIVLDEQAAGLHPKDALYQIAEELGLDSPHVVHAHK